MNRAFNPTEELRNLKFNTKETICNILTDIYENDNDGLLPNWEEEEEIVVSTKDTIGTFTIDVNIPNTYEEYDYLEKRAIKKLIVTLDYNLYLLDENENDIDWQEITCEELVWICNKLQEYINK